MNEGLTIKKRTISVVVDNCAGVLARVSNLFSRRGFNIDSLAVGTTEKEEFSRITIVVKCDDELLEQIVSQLRKLECVYRVAVLNDDAMVTRELTLIKVNASAENRSSILEIADVFRAKVIDLSPDTITMEVTGTGAKTDAIMTMLSDFGVVEVARTGLVALDRGRSNIYG